MKRLFSARSLAAAALALGAVGVASAAHARSDVILSIGLNAPYGYGYVQPAPVYVEPQPVYVTAAGLCAAAAGVRAAADHVLRPWPPLGAHRRLR